MSDKAEQILKLPLRLVIENGYATVYDADGNPDTPIIDIELGWTDTQTGPYVSPEREAEKIQFLILAANNHYKLVEALEALLCHTERNTCLHEDTHRGGVLWEICDDCGAKWADDEGGKPEFKWPAEVEQARQALAEVKS